MWLQWVWLHSQLLEYPCCQTRASQLRFCNLPCSDSRTTPASFDHWSVSDLSSLVQLWGGRTTVVHPWERLVKRNVWCAQIFIQGCYFCRPKREFTILFFKWDVGIQTIVLILINKRCEWCSSSCSSVCFASAFPCPPYFLLMRWLVGSNSFSLLE